MNNPIPPPPPPGPPPADKKGLSGLAIAGIGCLGLLVLFGIAGAMVVYKGWQKVKDVVHEASDNPTKAAALLAVKLNPDLELVKTDDAKGEITIRDKKSGEVTTLSFDDMSQGKFTVKDAKGGETTVDVSGGSSGGKMTIKDADGKTTTFNSGGAVKLPRWVTTYKGAEEVPGGMHTESPEGVAGMHQVHTSDPVAKVKEGLEAQLKADGFTTETHVMSADGKDMATIQATKEKHTINVVVTVEAGKTVVVTNYEGPKE